MFLKLFFVLLFISLVNIAYSSEVNNNNTNQKVGCKKQSKNASNFVKKPCIELGDCSSANETFLELHALYKLETISCQRNNTKLYGYNKSLCMRYVMKIFEENKKSPMNGFDENTYNDNVYDFWKNDEDKKNKENTNRFNIKKSTEEEISEQEFILQQEQKPLDYDLSSPTKEEHLYQINNNNNETTNIKNSLNNSLNDSSSFKNISSSSSSNNNNNITITTTTTTTLSNCYKPSNQKNLVWNLHSLAIIESFRIEASNMLLNQSQLISFGDTPAIISGLCRKITKEEVKIVNERIKQFIESEQVLRKKIHETKDKIPIIIIEENDLEEKEMKKNITGKPVIIENKVLSPESTGKTTESSAASRSFISPKFFLKFVVDNFYL